MYVTYARSVGLANKYWLDHPHGFIMFKHMSPFHMPLNTYYLITKINCNSKSHYLS
jgi:hypothetical protein